MSATYNLIETPGPGLALISRRERRGGTDTAIWSECTLRKTKECAITGRTLKPGTKAYRPTGNQMYRYERISAEVIDAVKGAP